MWIYLLNNPASVHAIGELQYVAHHVFSKDFFLGLVTVFEEFLNYVVSKHVLHQLHAVFFEFAKHLFLLIAVCTLELLL